MVPTRSAFAQRLPEKSSVKNSGADPDSDTRGAVVQMVRMPACHAGGHGFKSRPFRQHLDQVERERR